MRSVPDFQNSKENTYALKIFTFDMIIDVALKMFKLLRHLETYLLIQLLLKFARQNDIHQWNEIASRRVLGNLL